MAETVLSILQDKLVPFLKEAATVLLWGVHGEVDYLKDELDVMKASINDAVATDHKKEVEKILVKQMRDAASDIEDVLSKIAVLGLAQPPDQQFLQKLFYYVKKLMAQYRIATQIQDCKTRIRDISERKKMYNFDGLSSGTRNDELRRNPGMASRFIETSETVEWKEVYSVYGSSSDSSNDGAGGLRRLPHTGASDFIEDSDAEDDDIIDSVIEDMKEMNSVYGSRLYTSNNGLRRFPHSGASSFIEDSDAEDVESIDSVIVIANGLCKKLCLRLFPEVSNATHAIEVYNSLESQERRHRVCAFLARGLTSVMIKDCIFEAISASSTDNYARESIQETLEPRDTVGRNFSYWSSKGKIDPWVPETLTYSLISKLCFISEINIQPFQAYFQYGCPVYSAKFVRFRMGHLKSPEEIGSDLIDEFAGVPKSVDDNFVWTYISPEFPMAQENRLQKFKLPQPILCIGGFLQIELLGGVQRQGMDGLFYICVSHVQVVGRPLSPAFDVEAMDLLGKCVLKYYPKVKNFTSSTRGYEDDPSASSQLHTLMAIIGQGWEQLILPMSFGHVAAVNDSESDEELSAVDDSELDENLWAYNKWDERWLDTDLDM